MTALLGFFLSVIIGLVIGLVVVGALAFCCAAGWIAVSLPKRKNLR